MFQASALIIKSFGGVAQRLEQAAHNRLVAGSSPAAPTKSTKLMPTFDIVSEIDRQEILNAVDQARRELATRFDFKGSEAKMEIEKDGNLRLTAEDASRLKGLREIAVAKLAKRNIDLRNVEQKEPEISPLGHARQLFVFKQGLEGDKAKEISKFLKASGLKIQSTLQDRQIRVTGKKRDDLQEAIAALRAKDFGVALNYTNFRD